jgi:hypothetical protein
MFAAFNKNSTGKVILSFPRVRVQHNIGVLDFYDAPDWSNIGVVQPTGGLIFPKMSMPFLQLDRNTNFITWARDASALFVHGGWAQWGSMDDNILQVGDTFSFSQNGGPACTGSESTFTDCYFDANFTVTGNQLIPTVTSAQILPANRAATLAGAGFSQADCTTRWTGIGSSNTCLAGSTVQARIDAAFSDSGWEPATTDKGADPDLVWGAIGIIPSGPEIVVSVDNEITINYTTGFGGECSALIGEGADTDYATALWARRLLRYSAKLARQALGLLN